MSKECHVCEIEQVLRLTDEERGHMKLVLYVRGATLKWTL